MEVYIVEELPTDIAAERGVCKYRVGHFLIERETNTLVWVKRLSPGCDVERMNAFALTRYHFDRFGRFPTAELARKKIETLLTHELMMAKAAVDRIGSQLELFYSE